MKTKIFMFVFVLLSVVSPYAKASVSDSTAATEWIAIKESSLDSVTLDYFKQKGMVYYATPKQENSSIFVRVVSYLGKLLDSSLSSISGNSNKFYNTPVGFWVVWGVFYHYTGGEILQYLLTFLYLIVITILFLWLWRKNGIHKVVPIEEETAEGEIEVKSTADTVRYEIKHANVSMQFWLLIVYFVLFFIGACVL
jgi:hypothetical protein